MDRKEEYMDTTEKPDYDSYPAYSARGSSGSASAIHSFSGSSTSTDLSTNHNKQASWNFAGLDISFVKILCGRELGKLKSDGKIELEVTENLLVVRCLFTRNCNDIYEVMHTVEKGVSLLKKNRNLVSLFLLPESGRKKVKEYIEGRNSTISDGYLHLRSDYVDIYGINYDVNEREKSQLEAFLKEIKMKNDKQLAWESGSESKARNDSKVASSEHSHSTSSSRPHPDASRQPGFVRSPMFSTKEGMDVYVYKHSIIKLQTDAIVNAANEELKYIGGVAKVIAEKAGAFMKYECRSKIIKNKGPIRVTENVPTQAGLLKNKYIIHAVGPRWSQYQNKENCLQHLSLTVEHALETASALECVHVGMPAISAGIFGVPKRLCAEMYIRGIVRYSKQYPKSKVKQVHIVDIDDEIIRETILAYKDWKISPNSLEPKEALSYFYHNRPKSSQSASGNQYDNEAPEDGSNNRRKGDRRRSVWVHHSPSRILGLDNSVENFESDNGFFKVKIYTGSIVRVTDVDAILCSADYTLSGQGPLGTAIRTAAGKQYEKCFRSLQLRAANSKESVFKCEAGNLSVLYVIHVMMDTMSTVDRRKLNVYKEQLLCGFNKVNKWKLKAIALPLIGAGFVETYSHDLERVCEAMHDALKDFVREERSCKLCQVHLVNRNPNVTKTLIKYFTENSTPAAMIRQYEEQRTFDKMEEFKQTGKGARPKSTTRGMKSLDISRKLEDQHGKHRSQPFSSSVRESKHSSSPPQNFSATIHSTSRTSPDEVTVKTEDKKRCLKNTGLKQTEPSGNLIVLDGNEVKSSGGRKRFVNSRTRHPDLKKGDGKCCCCGELSAEMTKLQCGHSFCDTPCFVPMADNRTCPICNTVCDRLGRSNSVNADESSSDEYYDSDDAEVKDVPKTDNMCVICMDAITGPKQLSCGHIFCSDCIMQSMAHKPACPVCGKIFGELEGDQPEDGTMDVTRDNHSSLPGYKGYGTIEIKYVFQNGIQKENHPQPGQPYKGTVRRAFLPDNTEGQKVLRLLRKAFESRLTFTIGSSRTTGQEGVVTWNDIHHKTKPYGGAAKFGYPDPTYLSRVQDELAAKGIKE